MPEEYTRSRNRAHRREPSSKAPIGGARKYGRRLFKQTVFSLLLLSSAYLICTSKSDFSKTASEYVRSAISYKFDTNKIKDTISDLIKLAPIEKNSEDSSFDAVTPENEL